MYTSVVPNSPGNGRLVIHVRHDIRTSSVKVLSQIQNHISRFHVRVLYCVFNRLFRLHLRNQFSGINKMALVFSATSSLIPQVCLEDHRGILQDGSNNAFHISTNLFRVQR